MMHHLQAKVFVAAMAAVSGTEVETPKKMGFINYVKAENDLKAKVKKPTNGYQAKQRKRKIRRNGQSK